MMYDNEGKEQLLLNDYSDWTFINISLSVADQYQLFIYFVTAEVMYR